MLTVKQVVSKIRSEDWFVTIDLKDAYFHISILPSHRKFLRFSFRGEAYQYRVLPFGIALSPQFQKLLGLMAAASNVINVDLLYMRPLQWWLKTKGFSPRGNPLRMIKFTQRCLCALDMWRKPWLLSPVSLLANTLKGQQRLGTGPAGYPVLAHLDLVFRTYAPHDSPFWRIPLRKDLISQGTSHLGTPDHGMWQT